MVMSRKTGLVLFAVLLMAISIPIVLFHAHQMQVENRPTGEMVAVFAISGVLIAGAIALGTGVGLGIRSGSERAKRVLRILIAIGVVVGLAGIALMVLQRFLQ
jgi:hypothetical protein